MKYQIKKISVLQTSKVQAICYAPIGLIHLVIGLLILSSSEADTAAKAVGTFILVYATNYWCDDIFLDIYNRPLL